MLCTLTNAMLLLVLQATSSFDGMASKAKVADVYDAFGLLDTMFDGDVLGTKSKKNSCKSNDPLKETGAKKARLASAEDAASTCLTLTPLASPDVLGPQL
jgi:hypothetical protein